MTDIIRPTARAAIRLSCQNGFVIMEFEKSVDYLQMSRTEATNLLKALVERVNELTIQTGDGRLIGARN